MKEQVFSVQQTWRIRRVVAVVLGSGAVLAGGAAALQGLGWAWWLFAGVMLALVAYNLLGLTRQKWVVKVGPAGVDVCLATGRVLHAGWSEIEGHTITPGARIGALLVRSGKGKTRATRVLPIAIRLIGRDATEALLTALTKRLPGLSYRVPVVGGSNPD